MSKLNNDHISIELDLKAQKAQEEIHRLIKATEELRKQNQAYRKEKASLERVEGDHTDEYKRLNDKIAANTREIEANKRAMETERQKIDISRMSAAQLGKELKNLKRELNKTSKATNPKRYRELEDQIRRTEKAKLLGRTTTATAAQVTGLQTELAKLGFTQDVIEKLTPATLKLAKAVDTDLSSAAAFAGAAMRMFDKDASETEAVMASFAVATTKSALDFNKLQASLATVGPVAHNFGISLEDTTSLLGKLSDAGFDASSAATATRNILLNLADANGELAKALARRALTLHPAT